MPVPDSGKGGLCARRAPKARVHPAATVPPGLRPPGLGPGRGERERTSTPPSPVSGAASQSRSGKPGRRAAAARAPTQAAEEGRAEAPGPPPAVPARPSGLRLPATLAVPSACTAPRGWRVRRDHPDPAALTSSSGSGGSRERPPAAVPAEPEARPDAGSRCPDPAARLPGLARARGRRRRGSRRAAAERAAAGTVCKLPALAGPSGASTLGPDAAETLRRFSRPGRGSVRNFFPPSLLRPLQLRPAPGLVDLAGRDSGQGRSANSPPSPAERSANSVRPSLSGAVCKLSTPSERTSPSLAIPQPKG
ncbi:skin secretory protein xP2-like [Dasypus novemcinctus]|uniref:skin secretory protein xP2-like n=1 Tax=Dasypus novemcinctus TaxID=9361 RepID=UPI0039C994A2